MFKNCLSDIGGELEEYRILPNMLSETNKILSKIIENLINEVQHWTQKVIVVEIGFNMASKRRSVEIFQFIFVNKTIECKSILYVLY